MKKIKSSFVVLLFLLVYNSYSQNRVFRTIKIAQWNLEKFPVAYLKKAKSIYTEKDKFSGKLRYYEERNAINELEGLRVIMQRNLQYPNTIEYIIKGVIVYRAEYFENSSIAFAIRNLNSNDILDGPQIRREKNYETNKYDETVILYKNGVSNEVLNEEVNESKYIDMKFNKNGLLEGDFFMALWNIERYEYITGYAKNGEIQRVKCALDSKDSYYDIYEKRGDTLVNFHKSDFDSIHYERNKWQIITSVRVTNLDTLKLDNNYYYYDKKKRPAFKIHMLFFAMTSLSKEKIHEEKY
jgi:hypothetical protein